MCLNCFLDDSFQNSLKQSSRSDRFETTMEVYRDRFLSELDGLSNAATCDHIPNEIRTDIAPWIDCFLDTVRHIGPIKLIFDTLIGAFRLYVDGRPTRALEQARNIVKKHPPVQELKLDDIGLVFRGRPIDNKTAPINSEFFYHLPFNKRFYVSNQRFSISGIPILYLSRSLLGVKWELSGAKDIAYAAFRLAPYHLPSPSKVPQLYDLSNAVHRLINHVFINFAKRKIGIPNCNDLNFQPNINTFPALFHRFIISQMCTFRRDPLRAGPFVEEYLLAQLLTEAIKEEDYAGILFPSTRYWENANCSNDLARRDFPDNLALFTKYHHSTNFDDSILSLYDIKVLAIPPPKREWDAEVISNQIDSGVAEIWKRKAGYPQKLSSSVNIIHSQLATVQCDGHPYFESELGQMELEAEFDYLNFLLA